MSTEAGHELWGSQKQLSASQVDAYLERIGLKAAEIRARPADVDTLATLQLAHLLYVSTLRSALKPGRAVPFETTAVHFDEAVYESEGTDEPIRWRDGPGVSVDLEESYRVVVEQRRGGYCFSLNGLYAALLSSLGFRFSQYVARLYAHRNQDPAKAGYLWTGSSHVLMLVDLPGGPWLTDVGFGGGICSKPVSVVGTEVVQSLSEGESFIIEREALPGAAPDQVPGELGWTLYRYFAEGSIKSPCYWISPLPVRAADIVMTNFWNSSSEDALWATLLPIYLLLKDGSRRTCIFTLPKPLPRGTPVDPTSTMKVVVRNGVTGKIIAEEDVPMTYKSVLSVFRQHFGLPPPRKSAARSSFA